MTISTIEPFQRFIFMLLYAPGFTKKLKEPITGNLWIHKMMFLLSKVEGDFEDEFAPYYLGPFSEKLEAYLEQFESSDYIVKPSKIFLTEDGEEIARQIWEGAKDEERKTVESIKSFVNDLKDEELLGYIYQSYPNMTEKSKVKEAIDKKLKEIAVNLFKNKKISLEKAAEVAGLNASSFRTYLISQGIPAYKVTRMEITDET